MVSQLSYDVNCYSQGKIRDGTQVAVKKLAHDSKQGKPQFLAEVMTISKVQHRNLVNLRGCCVEGRHRLLVYEYLEGKSLRETLLGTAFPPINLEAKLVQMQ